MTEEKLEEKVDAIKIETGRIQIPDDAIGCRDYVSIRGIVSVISFSEALKDWEGKSHQGLVLKTTWFNQSYALWKEWLETEKQIYLLAAEDFGELHEPFSSYTPERLKRWQQEAASHHEDSLARIKDLYWKKGKIPENFLKY